jgi:hypothetical protein
MKKWLVLMVAAVTMASGFAAPASAAVQVSGDAYAGIFSKYIWRGMDQNPDANFVVQSGADLSAKGFTLSWWGNFDENTGNLTETDVTLDYSFDPVKLVSVSVGNILYDVDGYNTDNELYLGATLNTLLSPSFKVYYDYDEANNAGLFYTLSVSHSLDLAKGLALNLGALASYNQKSDALVGKYSGFHNAELSASVDYAVTDQLTVTPSFLFSTPLSNSGDKAAVPLENQYVGGLNVAYSF